MVVRVPAKWYLPLRRVNIRRNLLNTPKNTQQRLSDLREALQSLTPICAKVLGDLLVQGKTESEIVDELNENPALYWKEDKSSFTVRDVDDICSTAYAHLRAKDFEMHEVDSLMLVHFTQ